MLILLIFNQIFSNKLQMDEKQLKSINSKANHKKFVDHVVNGNVEKVNKMCTKGLDPNFHCADSGGENIKHGFIFTNILQAVFAPISGTNIYSSGSRETILAVLDIILQHITNKCNLTLPTPTLLRTHLLLPLTISRCALLLLLPDYF